MPLDSIGHAPQLGCNVGEELPPFPCRDRPQDHAVCRLRGAERRVGGQELSWLEDTAIKLKLDERVQRQELYWVGGNRVEELFKADSERLKLACFRGQVPHLTIPQQELIAQAVLREWHICREYRWVKLVECQVANQGISQRVPYRRAANPANMQAAVKLDETVDLSEQLDDVAWQPGK